MTYDAKTSHEAFRFYKRWEKALLAADIDLPKGCPKIGFVAYCLSMAVHGTNGIDCFASDATACAELDISNRRDIAKYRHAAVDLGWLEPNGKRHGRAEGLNIAIPSQKRQAVVSAGQANIEPTLNNSPTPAACDHPRKTFVGELNGAPTGQCETCGAHVPMG